MGLMGSNAKVERRGTARGEAMNEVEKEAAPLPVRSNV